jgi:hypothetical protein
MCCAFIYAMKDMTTERRLAAMEKLLSVLYGASGITAALLYVPQVFRYHRDRQACLSISLLAWSGWIVIGVITFLYAAFVARNLLFATVVSLNVMAQSAVLAYGIRARLSMRYANDTPGYVSSPCNNSGKWRRIIRSE